MQQQHERWRNDGRAKEVRAVVWAKNGGQGGVVIQTQVNVQQES